MQAFLDLAGFLGQAAGTAEEQAKNFCWGLHKSILDHVMCIQFTDVAQVADVARNLEILHDGDYDRQGGGGNYRNNNNNKYSRDNNREFWFTAVQGTLRVTTHLFATHVGRRHPGECRRAAGTCFKCGQAGHLQAEMQE
ncbi:hypothetical protein Tco_0937789 [Tanacetum coccineum]|uniref:CCHC-type domain-containing protein n=1 Tax=Tanacetum coccineum TaxID=301880 RepID=A0ABQ5DG01_9ASTR